MKFRPRYSLRTLFVLVALAAIACSWAINRLNLIKHRHAFIAEEAVEWQRFSPSSRRNVAYDECRAPGFLWLFGEKGSGRVFVLKDHYIGGYTERDMNRFRTAQQLFPEAKIWIVRQFEIAGFGYTSGVDDRPDR